MGEVEETHRVKLKFVPFGGFDEEKYCRSGSGTKAYLSPRERELGQKIQVKE